ncbi:MAG: hypothetical protein J6Y31_05265 [Bacteroidales bacterium]|nr:hypothetical protein [Bacteroidales bacterium]
MMKTMTFASKIALTCVLCLTATLSFAQKGVRYRGSVDLDPGLGLIQMSRAQMDEMGYVIPFRWVFAGAGIGTVQGVEIQDHFFVGAGAALLGTAVTNGDGGVTAGFGLALFLDAEYTFLEPSAKTRPYVAVRAGYKGCAGIASPTWSVGGGIRLKDHLAIGLMYSQGYSRDDEYDSPLLCHVPHLHLAWFF